MRAALAAAENGLPMWSLPRAAWRIFKDSLKRCLPADIVRRIHLRRLHLDLRLDPLRRAFGHDAGTPVDRYYIEAFLARHREDIRGNVLEVRENRYAQQFGGDAITGTDVLDIDPGNRRATLLADLTQPDDFTSDRYDCIILTQVLQQIFDLHAALKTLHKILKRGGVVLATVPAITPIDRYAFDRHIEFWRFTPLSVQRLFAKVFASDMISVTSAGNIFTSICFLHGVVLEEIDPKTLDHQDAEYPLIVAVRAVKR